MGKMSFRFLGSVLTSFFICSLAAAQAGGDASVLADKGRPVLTLTLTDPAANISTLFNALR